MKGFDTNVLLRFLTADEPKQSRISRQLIEDAETMGDRLHLSALVLVELVWVLRGRRYSLSRSEIADLLDELLDTAVFEVQDRDLVRRATSAFRAGPADFSDCLIGEIDRRAGCETTLTFDRRLARTSGFEEARGEDGSPPRVSEP